MHRPCLRIGLVSRAVGYSESALDGTKLPAWFIIERKQVFLSGFAAGASSRGKGIRTDVNSRPDADAQRPLAPGNVPRVVSRIFKRRRNLIKVRGDAPTVNFFSVVPWFDVPPPYIRCQYIHPAITRLYFIIVYTGLLFIICLLIYIFIKIIARGTSLFHIYFFFNV